MRDVEAMATPHLLTVAEYMTLGIDTRTELLGGIIYDVSPKDEPHSRMVGRLAKFLNRTLSDDDEVRVQDPIAVSGWTGRDAPEIDIAVIAAKAYSRTPTAADAAAFIEVSDTTYAFDRNTKIPLYVNAGVRSWIVNLRTRRIESYASPADLQLEHGRIVDTIRLLDAEIAADSLFPLR
jgi:Uma2 family endonuclease